MGLFFYVSGIMRGLGIGIYVVMIILFLWWVVKWVSGVVYVKVYWEFFMVWNSVRFEFVFEIFMKLC